MRLKLREEKLSSFEVASRVEEKRTRGRSFQEEPGERMTLRRDAMSRVAPADEMGRISRRTRPPILVIMGVKGLKVRQIEQENARIFLMNIMRSVFGLGAVDPSLEGLTVTPALVVLYEGILREGLDVVLGLEEEH